MQHEVMETTYGRQMSKMPPTQQKQIAPDSVSRPFGNWNMKYGIGKVRWLDEIKQYVTTTPTGNHQQLAKVAAGYTTTTDRQYLYSGKKTSLPKKSVTSLVALTALRMAAYGWGSHFNQVARGTTKVLENLQVQEIK